MIGAIEARENTLDSREVAEMVGKNHKDLLRDIRRYYEQLNECSIEPVKLFRESTYKDGKGEERPGYRITKKGCEFIAHKLTGVKGTEFTVRYIERFHEMEEALEKRFDLSQLSPELQAIFAHDKKIQAVLEHMEEHESRLGNLEDTMTVDYGQQKVLNDLHHSRGAQILGGKQSVAYQNENIRNRTFREMWRDYKYYFEVASYRDTPVARYKDAKNYLRSWEPNMNLRMEIAMAKEMSV